jgi:hypothetical protein
VTDEPVRDEGGDDACWLDRVCDRCGAFIDDAEPHVCRQPADTSNQCSPSGRSDATSEGPQLPRS